MNDIIQDIKYRLSILSCAENTVSPRPSSSIETTVSLFTVSAIAKTEHPKSLDSHSRRPHSHLNQHTEKEIRLIRNMHRCNSNDGLVMFWVKLQRKGYR